MPRLAGLAVLAALALPLPASAAQAAPSAQRPLEILLTNDDGFFAPGLQTLRDRLRAAGHHVTVVAPAANQSGTSVSLQPNDQITARQESPGVWSVAATPADAVAFGLQIVFAGRVTDLVVSGINPGHNTGALANHSGTVGAAIMANELKVPSIAVSTEFDPADPGATAAAMPATADYLTGLIGKLRAHAGEGRLLPPHITLNVNYPLTPDGPRGTKITQLGRTHWAWFTYTPAGGDVYKIEGVFPGEPEPVPDADNTALKADYVSVSPLDADWSAAARLGFLRG